MSKVLKLLLSLGITVLVICISVYEIMPLQILYYVLSNVLLVFTILQVVFNRRVKLPIVTPAQKTVNAIFTDNQEVEPKEKGENMKVKQIFEKYAATAIAGLTALLSIVEGKTEVIGQFLGDFAYIGDFYYVPYITLVISVIIGILSNRFTKEQALAVKALIAGITGKEAGNQISELEKQRKEVLVKIENLKKEFATILATVSALESAGQSVVLVGDERIMYARYQGLHSAYNAQISSIDDAINKLKGENTNASN